MVQAAVDNDAIIATVMDYFEGWFNGDTKRMERALHPNFNKRHIPVDKTGAQLSNQSTALQMIGWTRDGEGKAEGRQTLRSKSMSTMSTSRLQL